jgi:ElaB/YqjD/DUF883 family membrane-anchored ribosome-binding protein
MSTAAAEKSKILNGGLAEVTDRLEDGVRSARRAVKHGRYAVEDILEDAQHAVKRNPFGAVGIAFVAGLLAGGVATWLGSRRS